MDIFRSSGQIKHYHLHWPSTLSHGVRRVSVRDRSYSLFLTALIIWPQPPAVLSPSRFSSLMYVCGNELELQPHRASPQRQQWPVFICNRRFVFDFKTFLASSLITCFTADRACSVQPLCTWTCLTSVCSQIIIMQLCITLSYMLYVSDILLH